MSYEFLVITRRDGSQVNLPEVYTDADAATEVYRTELADGNHPTLAYREVSPWMLAEVSEKESK